MKIELFLQGKRVEINKDIDFVLNKQFTELTDLTTIIVDYSKTIKVPMTPHNNELFNYVYRLERQFIGTPLESITYDPSQKIDMYMTFNSSKVMDGYALLNSVNLKDRVYEINLYGQLGKIFSDLKNRTLGGSPGYHTPNNGWSVPVKMHTNTIYNSFSHTDHSLSWTSNNWWDFYGFAPQMIGDTDLLNTDCYERYNPPTGDKIIKFVDKINTTRNISYADIYLNNGGFDLNGYTEQRTYLCRPYVYVDKIIQMVQNEINQGDYDGYTMTFDGDWFNENNPYIKNMVYFPGNESVVDKGDSMTGTVTWNTTEMTFNPGAIFMPNATASLEGYTYTKSGNTATISPVSGNTQPATITLKCDNIQLRDKITGISTQQYWNMNEVRWAYYRSASDFLDNQFPIRYLSILDSSNTLICKLYMCDDTITILQQHSRGINTIYMSGIWNKLRKLSSTIITPISTQWVTTGVNGNYIQVVQSYNFGDVSLKTNSFKFNMGYDIIDLSTGELVSGTTSKHMIPYRAATNTPIAYNANPLSQYLTPIQVLMVSSNRFRSMSTWTINDILGNDFNPFLWMIDFVKQFRLYFDIDYVNKTIRLKKGYFDTVTYKNVVVDYSKGVTIEPVIDKYNSVDFGYSANNSTKGALYRKNWGLEYGDINIDTGLEINNDKLSLSPDKDQGVFIPVTLDTLTYTNLNSTGLLSITNPLGTSKVINTLDRDRKIQYFPFFAFRLENTTGNLYLSDDTPGQKAEGEYCYLEHSGWNNEVETIDGGTTVYYLKRLTSGIPQFDNYIKKSYSGIYKCSNCGYIYNGSTAPSVCPNCGTENSFTLANYLYWDTFNVPMEVYNGYLPVNDGNTSIYYERWKNYLSEIFNVHNNKVTCYVKMTYPEFINFKFNQLFVIDNVTFLVNKIIDFNPNSQGPTKVELIEISDPGNLK